MSTIKLNGTTSGSSIIKAPDSGSTNQTFTLPDSTGSLIADDGSGNVLVGGTAGAKNITVESTSGAGTISLIQLKNSSDSFNIEVGRTVGALTIRDNNNGERLKLDSTGAVTMPSQPAFLVKNAQLDNISVSTVTTIPYSNELFDQNSDFNTSNYTFTAPVTGKYQLNVSTYLNAVPVNAQYLQVRIVTSNHTYSTIIDPNFSANLDYYSQNISVLADMDANDTADVAILQQAGTQQLDIQGSGFFSGYLVA